MTPTSRTPTTPKTPAADSPSHAASRYQALRSHLAELKLHAAAEALPAVLDQATTEGLSLTVALVGTGLAMLIGTTLGIVAGYFRGVVDTVISRTVDVFLAFPLLLLALGIGSACSLGNGCLGGLVHPGMSTVIGIIVLFSWTYFARLARGQVLSLREKEFVEAARATGEGNAAILAREILPNVVPPVLVYLTLVIPLNILLEAALSYLGVGINPPQASWGQMIAESTAVFDSAWWYFVFPGLALVLTVLAFNLLGEAVRDALDPHMSKA